MHALFIKPFYVLLLLALLSACGGGGGGGSSSDEDDDSDDPPVTTGAMVELSGSITFESVPLNPITNGLDFGSASFKAARGIEVQLLNASSNVLDTTYTDELGAYSFDVTDNTQVRVRALARMIQTTPASWNVEVLDNTSSNALYAVTSSLINSGDTDSILNLAAETGFPGTGYTNLRQAAPFAILDTVYEAITLVTAQNASTSFADLNIFWSVNNSTDFGNESDGDIGTSFYRRIGSNSEIYILGKSDDDTDEFDTHVIAHEWCHYFQDRLARDDTMGGSHTLDAELDMRLAFSEGFCNAMSGMILDNDLYQDSNAAGFGFDFSLETQNVTGEGWYNEDSVALILYDIFDSVDDGVDSISQGFGSIYQTYVSSAFTDSEFLTNIHLFLDVYKQVDSAVSTQVDALATEHSIVSNDAEGTGETNDAGLSSVLPIYRTLTVGGGAIFLCSNDNFGTFNRLGNRGFAQFNIGLIGFYNITVTRISGATNTDPDYTIWRNGVAIEQGTSSVNNSETDTALLSSGDYIIEIYDDDNFSSLTSQDACFSVQIN